MRLKLFIILTFLILFTYCTSPDPANKNSESGQIESDAAKINKKIIIVLDESDFTNSDFKNYLRAKYSDLGNILNNNNLTSRLFDSFLEHSIILKSSESEIITITKKEISEHSGKNHLQLNENTKKTINDIIRIEKYLYKNIYNNISISKYEIQKYYNQNRKDFFSKQRIALYQILVKNKEEAVKVRGELLNNPSAFESLAKSESISQESIKNGYMGEFEKGELPKNIESVVYSLPLNQISSVVESEFGFHIFKVSKRERGKQRYLKDVSEDIEKIVFNKKMIYEFTRYMRILKKNIKIKINYDNFFFDYQDLKGD